MAYYFAVETTKDNYVAINARKTGFGTPGNEKKPYQFTLEELDKYTTKFIDREHLINFLLNQRIIESINADKKFCIIYSDEKTGACKQLPGEFIYKPYTDYLSNPLLAIEYILNRANNGDYNFFYELSEFIPDEVNKISPKDYFHSIGLILANKFTEAKRETLYKTINPKKGEVSVLETTKDYLISYNKKTRKKISASKMCFLY